MKIKTSPWELKSAYAWLSTIILISDQEVERLNDWTVGYYHCSHCNTSKGFALKLPSKDGGDPVSPIAHNERNQFFREHAHGDGRILLFEKDLPEPEEFAKGFVDDYDNGEAGFMFLFRNNDDGKTMSIALARDVKSFIQSMLRSMRSSV